VKLALKTLFQLKNLSEILYSSTKSEHVFIQNNAFTSTYIMEHAKLQSNEAMVFNSSVIVAPSKY